MKKLAQLFVLAGLVAFVACGPSAQQLADQAKADSVKKDSIQRAQTDSITAAANLEKSRLDAIAKIEAEKNHADSVTKGLIKKAKPAKK